MGHAAGEQALAKLASLTGLGTALEQRMAYSYTLMRSVTQYGMKSQRKMEHGSHR
jgi:hypothetical protein